MQCRKFNSYLIFCYGMWLIFYQSNVYKYLKNNYLGKNNVKFFDNVFKVKDNKY